MMWSFRPTSKYAMRLYSLAGRMASSLSRSGLYAATRNMVVKGFLLSGKKIDRYITVKAIELPGRLYGSFEPGNPLDIHPLPGGLMATASPGLDVMNPAGIAPKFPDSRGDWLVSEDQVGRAHAFGEPLPAKRRMLYSSWPAEFAGGVVFTHFYTEDDGTSSVVTDQKVWLAVIVRWSGSGPVRTVTFSEDYIREASAGYGFYPRAKIVDGAAVSKIRYGARLPVAHFERDTLTIGLELEKDSGEGRRTLGAGMLIAVKYERANSVDTAVIHAAELVESTDQRLTDGVTVSSYDLPAVFSYIDVQDNEIFVASFRARVHAGSGAPEDDSLITGQVKASLSGGALAIETDYMDIAQPAAWPGLDADRVFMQLCKDEFFESSPGQLARLRCIAVLSRPAVAGYHGSLNVHDDMSVMVTESAIITTQKQSDLGYGKQETQPGMAWTINSSAIINSNISTMIARGELSTWMALNESAGVVMASVKGGGITGLLNQYPLPRAARFTTYQQEVKDADGNIIVALGQVVSLTDDDGAKVAVLKGRGKGADFKESPLYSRWGLYYLQHETSDSLYGRVFG